MLVTKDGLANAPNHRLVALDERRKGQFGHGIVAGRNALQKLTVGQGADGPECVQGLQSTNRGP